jgi:uncharacterized protein DUF3658
MDRDQAAKIQEHLLDAARALDRATEAISDLGEEARRKFIKPLSNVVCDLHGDLLGLIYDRFPDLRPPSSEIPTISSTLVWEDVRLPPSVTEADIDGIILANLKPQWRKTALIVGNAWTQCKKLSWPIEAEILGARIQALADADRIEHQGDLRYWRHSEVRLKP